MRHHEHLVNSNLIFTRQITEYFPLIFEQILFISPAEKFVGLQKKRCHAAFLTHMHFLCPLTKATGWENVLGVATLAGWTVQGYNPGGGRCSLPV